MKNLILIPFLGAVAFFGSSCYPSDYGSVHTKRGAVVGGLVGAGAGALIGEHNNRELEGAAVGGVIGAITGGLLGSARDEQYGGRYYRSPQPYYPAPQPVYRYYQPAPVYFPRLPIYYGHSYSYNRNHYHNRSRSYGCRY